MTVSSPLLLLLPALKGGPHVLCLKQPVPAEIQGRAHHPLPPSGPPLDLQECNQELAAS